MHGNQSIMEAAAENKGDDLKVLAVTVLTSLDRGDLDDLGFACDVEALVLSRARRALEAGCDGVISSGLEVAELRAHLDSRLVVVTPGIRPVENKPAATRRGSLASRRPSQTAPTTSSSAGRFAMQPRRALRPRRSSRQSILVLTSVFMPAELKNDVLIRALCASPWPHAGVDHAPGRPLPARVPATRAKAGDFHELCAQPGTRLRSHAPAARALRARRGDPVLRHPDDPGAMGFGLTSRKAKARIRAPGALDGRHPPARRSPTSQRELRFVFEAVALIRRELDGSAPLIGFAGSPWTVATYMVEGGGSASSGKRRRCSTASPASLHGCSGSSRARRRST